MNTNLHGYEPYRVNDRIWMLDLTSHAITSGVVTVVHDTAGDYSYDVLLDGSGATVTNLDHADAYALQSYAELKLQLIVTPTPTVTPTHTAAVTSTPRPSPTPSVTVSNTVPFGPELFNINTVTWTTEHATITNGKIVSTSTDGVAEVGVSTVFTVPVNRTLPFKVSFNEGTIRSAKLTITGNNTGVVFAKNLDDSGNVVLDLFSGANTTLTFKVVLFEDSTYKSYAKAGYTYSLTQGSLKVETPTVTVTPSPTSTVTPTPSVTASHTITPTPSPTRTATVTPTVSATISLTPSVTPTLSVTPSVTKSAGATPTPTNTTTPSVTPTKSAGATPTPSATVTASAGAVSPTPTPTVTNTPSVTVTHTLGVTPSPTASGAVVTASPAATVTPTPTVTFTPSVTVTPSH